MTAPVDIAALLARNAVHRGAAPRRAVAAGWSFASLRGHLVEVVAGREDATVTAAAAVVRDAQEAREPVAWISSPACVWYPPDAQAAEIDVEAVVWVRVPAFEDGVWCADALVRTGGFGAVVVDGLSWSCSHRITGAASHRLYGLAMHHRCAVLVLTDREETLPGLVSVRVCAAVRDGAVVVQPRKDKRGPGQWVWERRCDGPPGLR